MLKSFLKNNFPYSWGFHTYIQWNNYLHIASPILTVSPNMSSSKVCIFFFLGNAQSSVSAAHKWLMEPSTGLQETYQWLHPQQSKTLSFPELLPANSLEEILKYYQMPHLNQGWFWLLGGKPDIVSIKFWWVILIVNVTGFKTPGLLTLVFTRMFLERVS